jgi:hypothetical protein
MAEAGTELQIKVASESIEALRRIAARAGTSEEVAASFLLANAIARAEEEAMDVADLLDRIPGAWERIQTGIDDARAGRTARLDDL